MTSKWMVQPGTNEVYAYNKHIVDEFGWRTYDGPLPKINKSTGSRILDDDCEFETVDEKELIRLEKEAKETQKRKVVIIEAMKSMPKIEFITGNGMPKLTSLEKACGFKPTLEEREAAFNEFTAEQKEASA